MIFFFVYFDMLGIVKFLFVNNSILLWGKILFFVFIDCVFICVLELIVIGFNDFVFILLIVFCLFWFLIFGILLYFVLDVLFFDLFIFKYFKVFFIIGLNVLLIFNL